MGWGQGFGIKVWDGVRAKARDKVWNGLGLMVLGLEFEIGSEQGSAGIWVCK